MEFSKLPHEVKMIAAKSLADRITAGNGFAESEVKGASAKGLAKQVRDAFTVLFADREPEGEKKAAAEKLATAICTLRSWKGHGYENIENEVNQLISAADFLLDKQP